MDAWEISIEELQPQEKSIVSGVSSNITGHYLMNVFFCLLPDLHIRFDNFFLLIV